MKGWLAANRLVAGEMHQAQFTSMTRRSLTTCAGIGTAIACIRRYGSRSTTRSLNEGAFVTAALSKQRESWGGTASA